MTAATTTGFDPDVPIRMENVSKWYGLVIGLNEVSVQIESGIVALLGPNGAGKSTMMKLLTGQLRPSIGLIRVFGRSIRSNAARRRVGYCPDVDAFYEEMSVRQFVYTMARLSGFKGAEASDRTQHALTTVGMHDRDKLRLSGCSKGMRQRTKLAQALVHSPDLLILDEPLSGLDPVGRREMCQLFEKLASEGKTLLISSHVLREMERLADRVVLISQGRVLATGDWTTVWTYLDDEPARVVVCGENIRDFVSSLIRFSGLLDVQFQAEDRCVLTSREPGELCDRIADLVRECDYPLQRLVSLPPQAETLFSLLQGGAS